jgi:hypothetical protein
MLFNINTKVKIMRGLINQAVTSGIVFGIDWEVFQLACRLWCVKQLIASAR